MRILKKLASLLGMTQEELKAKKKFPANPDRVPHTVTMPSGTIRTLCSFVTLDTLGNRVGKAHGPDNIGEHQLFYSYKPSRSKYKPKASVPGGLRRRLNAA